MPLRPFDMCSMDCEVRKEGLEFLLDFGDVLVPERAQVLCPGRNRI